MGNCGSIASTEEYMQKLRDICDANGPLLIMDEVKTGCRVANGVMLEPDSREPWFICKSHQSVDLSWLEKVAERSIQDAINS